MLFLSGMWLTPLSLALGAWTGAEGFLVLGGYLGLITSLISAITSAAEVIRFGRSGDPNLAVTSGPRAMAAD
jgi:uncharacterized protein